MPKISVIMPVYNTEEKYLKEAIESILNQTFTDFEFIIIDDGSSNNAQEVIVSYKNSRILYIKNEQNLGLIKTLNKGLDLAKGEYIARMDSDDISLAERFQKQADFLDKNSEVDILGTWFNCIPRDRVIETFTTDEEIKECMLINSNNIGHPTVMIRKSTVDDLKIRYDETNLYVEDYALWLSLIEKVKFANVGEILLNYRIHEKSVCQTKELEQSLNVQKIMVLAQGKYFGIDNTNVLNVIEKLKTNQNINSSDLLAINDFAKTIRKIMKESKFKCQYDMNKRFYKFAVRKCKKDFLFLKLLWTGNLNKLLRLHFGFKILNSIRFMNTEAQINYKPAKPNISAVMALYNTPHKLLKKTVKSILNQTFSDFELIVIDDASNLEYKEFFNHFNDDRIKYFRLEHNKGPGYARNEGIKKALGEYVAIVDSDDIYMKNRFEVQKEFLDKHTDISLLSGVFQFSNNKKKSSVMEKDKDIKTFMLFNSALTNAAVMLRTDIFIKKNLFYPEKLTFGEDYSLWLDAMFSGIKMANLNDKLMIYVRRKNQLSKTKMEMQANILKGLYRKIFTHLQLDFSQEEIDLHYNIYAQKCGFMTSEKISDWFDKIIQHNKNLQIFDEQQLVDKKNQTIENYYKFKTRIFKLKILEYNFCIYKPFKITFEKRI